MKKLKITKEDIGRWVTVKWDDVGRRDSLIVDFDPEQGINKKHGYVKVFDLDGTLHTITADQIIEKRGYVKAG
jgi:hypothetical protein